MKKIAIQGIAGCFHEMAARKFFGEDVEMVECNSFKQVAETLNNDESNYALMAIENTLAGSLLPNYALISKYGFKVTGEVYLHIKMNLMALPGTKLESVKHIYSHPVALAQCEDYLETLRGVKLVEYHDTAAAAKMVRQGCNHSFAAIASELSAEIYNLSILALEIETHKQNFTRFLVLSKTHEEILHANKASLSLELAHEPGSLATVLNVFKDLKVNLTKIQSLPIIGKPYQYAFKMDVVWDDRKNFTESLEIISQMGNSVSVMGEYQAASALW